MADVTLVAAFIAGILSFASPCVLPILPGFLSYLGSIGLKAGAKASRMRIFLNSLAYVLGFTVVFSIFGVLLNGALGGIAYTARPWLAKIGGAIIIFFGLYMLGLFKLDFLASEHKARPDSGKINNAYLFSFLFGASFAIGWSPCVGAILGTILTLAAISPANSFLLLFTYSLGLGIPFLLAGAFVAHARCMIKSASPFMKYFNIISGLLLILLGMLVFTGTINDLANLWFAV